MQHATRKIVFTRLSVMFSTTGAVVALSVGCSIYRSPDRENFDANGVKNAPKAQNKGQNNDQSSAINAGLIRHLDYKLNLGLFANSETGQAALVSHLACWRYSDFDSLVAQLTTQHPELPQINEETWREVTRLVSDGLPASLPTQNRSSGSSLESKQTELIFFSPVRSAKQVFACTYLATRDSHPIVVQKITELLVALSHTMGQN